MCARMLVHIPKHLGRTNNNNKRCQLIIRCMFCNLGRIDLVYDNMRYMVYRWGFSCLDYFFDVLIFWSHKMDLYRWFCRICFHRVLFQIFDFVIIIIIIIIIICIHPALLLVFYPHWSPVLIILCYTYSLLDITYYLSACSGMHVLTTQFLIHALLVWIDRYTCVCPCTSLDIHHTTRWGVSNSPGCSCLDPRACGFSWLLIKDA